MHLCYISFSLSDESDVADGVLFLLSDKAKMVTGTLFHIDGGLTSNWRWGDIISHIAFFVCFRYEHWTNVASQLTNLNSVSN